MAERKLISIVTPCFNEEGNVEELHERIVAQMERSPHYDFEQSTSTTPRPTAPWRRFAVSPAPTFRVKAIVNLRNFGHIRSPIHGLLQARGDAVITMASDMQEPPELIPDFLAQVARGRPGGGRRQAGSHETWLSLPCAACTTHHRPHGRRRLIPHSTGFGLYDRSPRGVAPPTTPTPICAA